MLFLATMSPESIICVSYNEQGEKCTYQALLAINTVQNSYKQIRWWIFHYGSVITVKPPQR